MRGIARLPCQFVVWLTLLPSGSIIRRFCQNYMKPPAGAVFQRGEEPSNRERKKPFGLFYCLFTVLEQRVWTVPGVLQRRGS